MENNNAFVSFFRRLGEKIDFRKNKRYIIIYGAVILATVIVFSALLGWAAGGKIATEITVVRVTALAREGTRREYIVGETPETDGFALVIDGRTVTDCSVEIDTSTAGVKAARVYKEDGDTVYEGRFPVTVFAVRHLDIHTYPASVTADEDGLALEGMEVWAELSGEPKELPLQTEHADWTTTIVLSPDKYEVSFSDDATETEYSATVRCGNCSVTFAQAVYGGRPFRISSFDRVLHFTNAGGTGETLTLVVEQTATLNQPTNSYASGTYVFTDAQGKSSFLKFSYYAIGWSSNFTSSEFGEGLTDRQDGDDMEATYGGVKFTAAHSDWTKAILNV